MAEPAALSDRPTGLRNPSPGHGRPHLAAMAPALAAYGLWGFLPLYFHLLKAVSPVEVVVCRVLFSVPVCLAMAAMAGTLGEVWRALRQPRLLAALLASTVLIVGNWLIYVTAIAHGHVLAASLGYYINPLLNVLLGTAFLHERLRRRQWLAVGIAAIGVALLAAAATDMLWISMALALTFALYALVRKLAPISAIAGQRGELTLGRDTGLSLLLAAAGVITAVPLVLFARAARTLDLSTLGVIQYLTPSLLFLESVVLFNEPVRPVQLASFALIWAALALYTLDLIGNARSRSGRGTGNSPAG